MPSPNPAAGGAGFNAVSCASPSACTGVGASNSGTLAERWNGTRWSLQPTPNPVAAFQITLDSVACPARRFCTAVGDYGVAATGAERLTLGLQWRGTGHGLQRSTAALLPGAGCAGLPAVPSRLIWGRSDAWRALTTPSLQSRALTQRGLIRPLLSCQRPD
jgi:hypothetical protein